MTRWGAGTVAVLALIVVAAVNLPRNVLNVFNISMLRFGNDLPYLGPLCLLLLVANLIAVKDERRWVIPVGREDKYFVVAMVVWTLLEVQSGSAQLYLVLSNSWFFVFYALLRSYAFLYGPAVIPCIVRVTAHTTIAILVYHVILQVVVITGAPGSEYIDAAEVLFANGMSMLGLLLLYLVMFHRPHRDLRHPVWYCGFAAALAVGVIGINRSRGAVLGLIALLALRAVSASPVRMVTVGAVGVLALLAVWSLVATPFDEWLNTSSLAQQVDLIATGVRGGLDLAPEVVHSLPDDFVSAYARAATVFVAGQAIAASPIWGNGLSIIFDMRVANYILHSYALYPMVAYGLVGTVPYLLFFVSVLRVPFARTPGRTIAALALLAIAMVFDNEIWPWYAVLLIALRADDRRELVRGPVLPAVAPAAQGSAVL